MTRLLLLATSVASAFSSAVATHSYSGSSSGGVSSGGDSSSSYGSGQQQQKSSGMPTDMTGMSSEGYMLVKMTMGGGEAIKEVAKPAMAVGKTWIVQVGGDAGLVYSPPTITAPVGDMIQFDFLQKNHTLTQSTFETPCKKMVGGMDTGFVPNANGISPPPMAMFQVMTDKPQWFYCRQKGHCGKGMVFSINPTAEKSQDAFVKLAIQQNGTMDMGMGSTSTSMGAEMTTATMTTESTAPPAVATTAAAAAAIPPAVAPAAAPAPAPAVAAPPSGYDPSMLLSGNGSGAGDSCSCTCMCGVSAFPAADQGMGMWGGYAGAVPAVAAAPAAPPAAAGGYKFKA